VIAIDQLDTLFAQTSTAFFSRREGVEESHARQVAPIADGLLMLRDITQRTLVVVSGLLMVLALPLMALMARTRFA